MTSGVIGQSVIHGDKGHIEMYVEVIIMKTAPVSEPKALLNKTLLQVKAGEEVMITDRGKPIAKIVPITQADTEISAHLLNLDRAGLARIGGNMLPKVSGRRRDRRIETDGLFRAFYRNERKADEILGSFGDYPTRH